MGRDGKPTRSKILAESKDLIYENGFSGTSVDMILERTGITKGAFFYHFKTKADLAKTLISDFATSDLNELARVMEETEQYIDQPKKRLIAFVECFIKMFSGIEESPSCLYASVSNEQNQYNEEIKQVVNETIMTWRRAFEGMIDKVIKKHPAKINVDKAALADHFTVVIEGAFIVSKAINDPSVTANQLTHLKNYFELLFED